MGKKMTGQSRSCALLCDLGNTSLKIALADESGLKEKLVWEHRRDGLAELGVALKNLARFPVRMALVASVAPSVDAKLRKILERELNIVPLFAGRDLMVPMTNNYADPARLGIDRLLAAWAARRLLPGDKAIIVADFGTAITFDCILQNEYLGGLIFPGPETAARALANAAERLPEVELAAPAGGFAIARDTDQGIRSGLFYGYAALVNGLCAELEKILPAPAKVVATGGFARKLMDFCPVLDIFYPDLVLRGLWLLGYYPRSENPEMAGGQF